jgi:hypothetical protein
MLIRGSNRQLRMADRQHRRGLYREALFSVPPKKVVSITDGYRQVEVPIIPHIKGRDFYPNLAQVSKGIKIAYINPSIGVTTGGSTSSAVGYDASTVG